MEPDYKKTFLISLGFFTVSVVWNIYNVAVPIDLKNLGLSGAVVGSVMTIGNFLAVIFLPVFGALSDKTNTRYGRRMPYLLVGIPLSAIAFFLVPFARFSLLFLMIAIIALNFFMSIYRAPTVALMPDFTPRPLRSKANGIINFMGGAGAVITFLMAGFLFKKPVITFLMAGFLFKKSEYYRFAAGSVILVATIILMYLLIREPGRVEEDKPQKVESNGADKEGRLMSLVFLLLAIFFWFAGYNAVETFFSTYGEVILGVDKSQASFLLAVFSGLFLVFTIPSGFIATKLGRKRTILAGIILLLLTFACLIAVREIRFIYPLMGVGGISWALININSYSMVVEMTSLAAIVSPILLSFLKDRLGDGFLFTYSAVAMVAAFFFMMLVRHGEAKAGGKSAFENIEHMES